MLITMNPERMRLAEANLGGNCIGTLVYVLGIADKEANLNFQLKGKKKTRAEKGFELILKRFTKLPGPQKNSIFTLREYEGGRAEHAGLVVAENPFMVWHRPGVNVNARSEPLESALRGYSRYPHAQYYLLSSFRNKLEQARFESALH